MKSFEQWWIKHYKYCVIAGVFYLALLIAKNGLAVFNVKDALIFFAVITSPIGALIGQVLVWIFKMLKLLLEIFVEYLKLRKAEKR